MKNTLIAVLLLVTGVAVGTAGVFLWPRVFAQPTGGVVCTADAMQCPDGSYVGRTGPRCEFAPCPGGGVTTPPVVNAPPAADGWEQISYSYPQPLTTTYITAEAWPPTVRATSNMYRCDTGPNTAERTVAGRRYCITAVGDGAAGHIYTTYDYLTKQGSRLVRISFLLRATQCGNYDDPQKTACERERAAFNADTLADQVAQTIRLE